VAVGNKIYLTIGKSNRSGISYVLLRRYFELRRKSMSDLGNPIDGLMAGYAAGTLPGPLFAMVQTHLQLSPKNRNFVADLELMSSSELSSISPIDLSARDTILEAVFSDKIVEDEEVHPSQASSLPEPLADLVGFDMDTIPWRGVLPGVKEHKIGDVDGCRMSMFWLKAGAGVPSHTHGGAEVTLVLEGGYSDAHGHYVAGDLAYADASVDHKPIADDDGDCIGFAITDAPLVLTGPLGRFFNPLMR